MTTTKLKHFVTIRLTNLTDQEVMTNFINGLKNKKDFVKSYILLMPYIFECLSEQSKDEGIDVISTLTRMCKKAKEDYEQRQKEVAEVKLKNAKNKALKKVETV